jgi:hypothetical protein
MGGLTAGPGHNRGPAADAGGARRRHGWTRARARLPPTLPLEVIRPRLARAAGLGLDSRTHASLRAASGHDLVARPFASDALRRLPPRPVLPAAAAARLGLCLPAERCFAP